MGDAANPNTLRRMSPRVRKPVSWPSCTTGRRSMSLLTSMEVTSASACSSLTQITERDITSRTRVSLHAAALASAGRCTPGRKWRSRSRSVTIPSTCRSWPTTGMARSRCSAIRSSTSCTGASGVVRNTRWVITSRTRSRGSMVISRISGISSTSAGERAATSRSTTASCRSTRASAATVCRYRSAADSGARTRMTICAAAPTWSGDSGSGDGAMPSATCRLSTASVRRCGMSTRSPTWMRSRTRLSLNMRLSDSASRTPPVSTSSRARCLTASYTDAAGSGATTCSGRRISVRRTSRPARLPLSLKARPGSGPPRPAGAAPRRCRCRGTPGSSPRPSRRCR